MRRFAFVLVLGLAAAAFAADVESRQLTHYLPQDQLEEIVRKEDWTEIPLTVKGGVHKGDVVRVWAGGLIDRGDADQPGQNTNGPDGVDPARRQTRLRPVRRADARLRPPVQDGIDGAGKMPAGRQAAGDQADQGR